MNQITTEQCVAKIEEHFPNLTELKKKKVLDTLQLFLKKKK